MAVICQPRIQHQLKLFVIANSFLTCTCVRKKLLTQIYISHGCYHTNMINYRYILCRLDKHYIVVTVYLLNNIVTETDRLKDSKLL